MSWLDFISFRSEDRVFLHKDADTVSCYEIPTPLVEGEHLAKTIASLRDSFAWTIRSEPHHPEDIAAVQKFISNGYEMLNTWDDRRLSEAIKFRDDASDGIFFELMGVQKELGDYLLAPSKRREELGCFINSEPSAITVIVIRLGDSPFWYVYVPRDTPEATQQFVMDGLRAGAAKSMRNASYKGLRVLKLESIHEGELSGPFSES